MTSPFDRGRPDFRDVAGQFTRQFGGWRRIVPILLVLLVLGIAISGTYSVDPGEQGVVRTFGRESGKSGPGLHYRIPFIQKVEVVNVEQIRRLEVASATSRRCRRKRRC
jgi:regulator of protease activity HflC (stomatin/prohibitin superfamily)